MAQSTRWTDEAFARLEILVREQEVARVRLEGIERSWSAQRAEAMDALSALVREYDELYAALDRYASADTQVADPEPWASATTRAAGFDATVAWDPIGAPEAARERGGGWRAFAVVMSIGGALGFGVLSAAVASGRVPVERITTASTAAVGLVWSQVQGAIERRTDGEEVAREVAIATPVEPEIAAVPTAAVPKPAEPAARVTVPPPPEQATTITTAKTKAKAKRATAKRGKAKRRSSRRTTAARRTIDLPATNDPLAGA